MSSVLFWAAQSVNGNVVEPGFKSLVVLGLLIIDKVLGMG